MARQILKTGATVACKKCGKNYYVSPRKAKSTRYCSKKCYDESQTGERKLIVCLRCGKEFKAAKDHGRWPKFCGIECRDFGAPQPEQKECPTCGGMFLATRSSNSLSDGLMVYCSFKCSREGLKRGNMRICICCGQEFYITPSTESQREESCCSYKCKKEFYTEERSPSWNGGEYLSTNTGMILNFIKRDGFVGKYIGQHRIVASKAIGRMLEPHEKILHINNVKNDNRPENLFICGSLSETSKRIHGSLPWPNHSNLDSYR